MDSFLLIIKIKHKNDSVLTDTHPHSTACNRTGVRPLSPRQDLQNPAAARSLGRFSPGGEGGLYLSKIKSIRSVGGGTSTLYPIGDLSLFNMGEEENLSDTGYLAIRIKAGL